LAKIPFLTQKIWHWTEIFWNWTPLQYTAILKILHMNTHNWWKIWRKSHARFHCISINDINWIYCSDLRWAYRRNFFNLFQETLQFSAWYFQPKMIKMVNLPIFGTKLDFLSEHQWIWWISETNFRKNTKKLRKRRLCKKRSIWDWVWDSGLTDGQATVKRRAVPHQHRFIGDILCELISN